MKALEVEVAGLRRELAKLNGHRFIRVQNSMPRLLFFQFLRGMALGLGTVVGGGLLLSVIVWALAQIDFIPIIGDWAGQIAAELQAGTSVGE
ncbi:hypothetical protein HKCCE3408_08810 [Rhodobacterales bacterium HKCCE3408]|nr:hypothetical protein [Rhodobacterales bacterium HKCCE3408]